MPLDIAALILGLAALIWGAERLVSGSAALAYHLGMPPLLIGITVVGFGTSSPELLVAAIASAGGNPGLAVGNAIGSNIANVGLIAGATAVVTPLKVQSRTLSREFPILIVVSFAGLGLLLDGTLGRVDGTVLLAGLGGLIIWLYRAARVSRDDPLGAETKAAIPTDLGPTGAIGRFVAGLAVLLLGSRMLVWGAADVARELGVSELLIGLTIVAIGTSLPELATSLISAAKREPDLAVGNILGSNLFNLLAVLSVPALIAPGPVESTLATRDVPVMLAFTVTFAAMAWGFDGPGRRINRIEGAALLAGFAAYMGMLVTAARQAPHVG
jgi:cation:H+ antiporter